MHKALTTMASALCSKTPSVISSSSSSSSSSSPSAFVRRRLPLVGAFCILSFGLANLSPALSSSFKTGCAQSLPLFPLFRSRFRSLSFSRMASSNAVVSCIVVYVTVPNKEAGKKLAESIVKQKLAACVNRVPGVESVYEWKGKIETDSEELLIIKTRESLLNALKEHVKANHEYDLPEVIALPIVGGSEPYLEWIRNSTRDP